MTKLRSQVTAFHEAFSVPVLTRPQVPSDERVRLRLRLIAEEFFELLDACLDAPDPEFLSELTRLIGRAIVSAPVRVDLPDAVDALADIQYVLDGTALEFGVDMGPIEDAVHASNMAKAGGPVVNGKITKPDGWTPPDIRGELVKQGWEGE